MGEGNGIGIGNAYKGSIELGIVIDKNTVNDIIDNRTAGRKACYISGQADLQYFFTLTKLKAGLT